jgi:CheY-like chemotaxis protein
MATVLVVDDQGFNRDLVNTVLRSHGHKILEADSRVAALEVLARLPTDLVLTDVSMPGMDGYQLARRIFRRLWLLGRVLEPPFAVVKDHGRRSAWHRQDSVNSLA